MEAVWKVARKSNAALEPLERPLVMTALAKEFKEYEEDRKKLAEEPELDGSAAAGAGVAARKFLSAWVPELKAACEEVIDMVGFSANVVQALAESVVLEHAVKGEDEVEETWEPSMTWCYWFMHKHLNLVCRRVTGHSYTPEEIAKQDELHQRNLKRIAVLRRQGLDPKYIFGSDQFGIHLFPQGAYKWAKKGDGHVTNLMKEDKRQLTGDLCELQSHVMSQWRLRYYCAFCPHPSAVINAKGKGVVDEWTARDEKLIAAQWRVYVESDTGLSSDKVRTTIQSVINECMDNDEPARANAWEGMLQQIEAAVVLIHADSGHAVANMGMGGELRL